MKLWDVNLWVYAFRADSPHHELSRQVLGGSSRDEENLFYPGVAASFLRLVTNAKIFREPSDLAEAWAFVDAIEARCHPVEFDPMSFGVFKHLCYVANGAGNQIPDLYLAAIALRHGATLVTFDKSFGALQGLKIELLAY